MNSDRIPFIVISQGTNNRSWKELSKQLDDLTAALLDQFY